MANIDDLLNDPDFMALPEEEQNQFVDELRQKDYGQPMSWGNIVSKVSRLNPFSISGDVKNTSDIGKGLFQTAQGTVGNLPQNLAQNPKAFLIGGLPGLQAKSGIQQGTGFYNAGISALGGKEDEMAQEYKNQFDLSSMFEPETGQGKLAAGLGNFAGSALPFAAPNAMARGINSVLGKTIEPFRSTPIKQNFSLRKEHIDQEIKTIKELMQGMRREFPTAIKSEAFLNKKAVPEAVGRASKVANQKYGRILDKISETHPITRGDFSDVLQKTMADLKIGYGKSEEIIKPSEQFLDQLASQFYDITKRDIPMTVKELKDYVSLLRSKIPGSDHALTAFYKNYGEAFPEIQRLNKAYRPIYETSKNVQKATQRGFLSEVSKGTAAKEELEQVRKAENKLGLLGTRRAEHLGKHYSNEMSTLEDYLAQHLDEKAGLPSSLKGELHKVNRRRLIAGSLAGAAALPALPRSIKALLSHIIPD